MGGTEKGGDKKLRKKEGKEETEESGGVQRGRRIGTLSSADETSCLEDDF